MNRNWLKIKVAVGIGKKELISLLKPWDKKVRRTMSYYHNIENFIINNFERSEQALLKGLKPKNLKYPFGSHSLLSMDLKKEKIAEEQQIDVIYYLFGGEISEFEFEEDSDWDYDALMSYWLISDEKISLNGRL